MQLRAHKHMTNITITVKSFDGDDTFTATFKRPTEQQIQDWATFSDMPEADFIKKVLLEQLSEVHDLTDIDGNSLAYNPELRDALLNAPAYRQALFDGLLIIIRNRAEDRVGNSSSLATIGQAQDGQLTA